MKKLLPAFIVLLALGLCGCATTMVMLGASMAGNSKSSTTTTSTLPAPGSYSVQGTVSSGGLVTTDAVSVALIVSKTTMKPVTSEACHIAGGSFTYSVPTSESGTYYLAAYCAGSPESWAGGPGVSHNDSQSNMVNALQAISLASGNPHQTCNFTLYKITGP